MWTRNCEQVREFDQILWEKDQEIGALRKMRLVTHTTLQPEVVAPVSTCAITSSFSPSICESPVTVMTTQATQRSIPTLSQPVCSSQVQHTSQLYLKAGIKPTTTQIRSFAQPIYQ